MGICGIVAHRSCCHPINYVVVSCVSRLVAGNGRRARRARRARDNLSFHSDIQTMSTMHFVLAKLFAMAEYSLFDKIDVLQNLACPHSPSLGNVSSIENQTCKSRPKLLLHMVDIDKFDLGRKKNSAMHTKLQ